MKRIPSVALGNREPAYRQIEQALREAISTKEWPCGFRLPTMRDLAKQYKTSIFTIQTALDALSEDGLIERTRRRGTFVTSSSTKIRSVGIYIGSSFVQGHAMAFYQKLNSLLVDQLESRNVEHRLWIDGRFEEMQSEPLPELADAVAKRQLQALIICSSTFMEMIWLQKLGIPLAALGSSPVPFRVNFDDERFVSQGIGELKKQGCRTVGVITPFSPNAYSSAAQKRAPKAVEELFDSFANCLADNHMETRNSWVRIPDHLLAPQEHEEFGYRQFQELWKQKQRPDGLLIWPDTIVRGSITAMLEAGVSVPGEIKLVLGRNSGIPVLCPLAASWLLSDVEQVAASLIRQVDRQFTHQPVTPILIPPVLESAVG